MSEQLNELFNVEQNEEPITDLVVAEPMALVSTSEIETAKEIHINLLNKAEQALNDLLAFAKESQSPRAYEVVGKLVDAQTNLAKSLMDLHKQKKDVDGDKGENAQKIGTQNNIVFAGSTSDLMKMISAERAKTIE